MSRQLMLHVVRAALMAVATWFLGWWGVVVVPLIIGALYRSPNHRPALLALAAAEAWALLLVIDAFAGPLGKVGTVIGGAMSLPPFALLIVTLLFPALLAWSSATVAAAVARFAAR
jgi:hypothetical protein